MSKVYAVTFRNRAVAILVIVALLAVGAIMLTVGLALLAGLVVGGTLIGAGVAAYRRLRHGRQAVMPHGLGEHPQLDPSLEVQPSLPSTVQAPRRDDV